MSFPISFPRAMELLVDCSLLSRRQYCTSFKRLFVATALLACFGVPAASAVAIGAGFSAMWFDPQRSGEGLQLEILDSSNALVEWYTYDEQGRQRWLQGVGQIVHGSSADAIQFPQMYVTHGGHFGPNFNPQDVVLQVVGDMTIAFSDCNSGTFHYNAFGQSQTLPLQRLTQTMGAGCAPTNGVPGQPTMSYAGQSGSWFDTSHSGEGFALQWISTNQAIVTWYTYDTAGNQVWLLGVGGAQNGAIIFPQMARTHGPHFGAAYDTANFQQEDWGSLTLVLSCTAGTAHYESKDPEFGTGDLTLARLTTLEQPNCPTVQPKLSDLYTLAWEEIPIDPGTPAAPHAIAADTIANDGTIAGRVNDHLVLWHPATQTWEDIPRDIAGVTVNISPDSSEVIATDAITADQSLPLHTLLWQRQADWQLLSGDLVSRSVHSSVSQNFKYIAGYGHNQGDVDHLWVRTLDGGQVLYPDANPLPGEIAYAVSNDGTVAVGNGLRFPTDFPERVAMRWSMSGQPTILHSSAGEELAVATACNSDCSLIFGAGLYNFFDPKHPDPGEAWYLKNDGTFGYLGSLSDAPLTARSYAVTDATADGSLVVGTYTAYANVAHPDADWSRRAFIWTQATGIVSLRALVTELGIGDDDWDEIDAVRLSPDSHRVLIGGFHVQQEGQLSRSRAVVLHMTPK